MIGSYPLILMIYNRVQEIEWDKRNISFLPNFRASSVTKCIKKLLMAYSCMKRGFKHTINEIILIFSSLPCYVRKEKLGRGNFLCKTWKIFYDSLNFLRISFPNYIYIIFWLRGITQKKRNMKLKQMWTLNSLFSRVSRKLSRPTSLWKKKTISHIHYWMHFLVSIS